MRQRPSQSSRRDSHHGVTPLEAGRGVTTAAEHTNGTQPRHPRIAGGTEKRRRTHHLPYGSPPLDLRLASFIAASSHFAYLFLAWGARYFAPVGCILVLIATVWVRLSTTLKLLAYSRFLVLLRSFTLCFGELCVDGFLEHRCLWGHGIECGFLSFTGLLWYSLFVLCSGWRFLRVDHRRFVNL